MGALRVIEFVCSYHTINMKGLGPRVGWGNPLSARFIALGLVRQKMFQAFLGGRQNFIKSKQ